MQRLTPCSPGTWTKSCAPGQNICSHGALPEAVADLINTASFFRPPPECLTLDSTSPGELSQRESVPRLRNPQRGVPAADREREQNNLEPYYGDASGAWPKPVVTRGSRGLFQNVCDKMGAGLGSKPPPLQFTKRPTLFPTEPTPTGRAHCGTVSYDPVLGSSHQLCPRSSRTKPLR